GYYAGGSDPLGADHSQQLQLLVAFAAGGCGEDHQRLRLVRVEQGLAVQFEHAQFRVYESLGLTEWARYRVLIPDAPELRTLLPQQLDQRTGPGPRPLLGGCHCETGDERTGMMLVILFRRGRPRDGVGEPAVHSAAGRTGED